jgi:hypothetical protein
MDEVVHESGGENYDEKVSNSSKEGMSNVEQSSICLGLNSNTRVMISCWTSYCTVIC